MSDVLLEQYCIENRYCKENEFHLLPLEHKKSIENTLGFASCQFDYCINKLFEPIVLKIKNNNFLENITEWIIIKTK